MTTITQLIRTQHFSADGSTAACGDQRATIDTWSTCPRMTDCARCERTKAWKSAWAVLEAEEEAKRAKAEASPMGRAMRAVLGRGWRGWAAASITEDDMREILKLKAQFSALSVSWPGDQREPTKADPLTSAMVLSRIRAETETAKHERLAERWGFRSTST